ncbi:hypothetical protein LJC57_09015 [Parabacteroides sp. OttesenSCG-928-G07]|nr:hypothetical protein [Parabacteroides sp. OttesenSCG-928-G21]MDL2278717.1 hypothetical protein [Parabacteroides sp. OttesenSCG-928-G07]
MKRNVIAAMVALFLFVGCDSPKESLSIDRHQLIPVVLSVSLKEELDLFHTRAMPPYTIGEPVVKSEDNVDPAAEEKEINALCNRIVYQVFSGETGDELLKTKQFVYGVDDDFGIVYDSLPPGNYRVAVIAHSSESATVSGRTFSVGEVSDTFHGVYPLTVEDNEMTADIELNRIVGKVEFVSSEVVPDNLGSFEMKVNRYSKQLDVLTGNGIISQNTHLISHIFTTAEIGNKDKSHAFLTFIPADSGTIEVELVAKDNRDTKVRQRIVRDILPVANRTIRYIGKLYSPLDSEDTITLVIKDGGKWGEDIEYILEN